MVPRPTRMVWLVFGIASCGGSKGGPPTSTGPKTPLTGLIDMQDITFHDHEGGEPTFTIDNITPFAGSFGGVVINATWDAIEPSSGGALDFSTIDSALAQVRTFNTAHPNAAIGVKLRVYHGSAAPTWAKQINGSPVDVVRNPQGCEQ